MTGIVVDPLLATVTDYRSVTRRGIVHLTIGCAGGQDRAECRGTVFLQGEPPSPSGRIIVAATRGFSLTTEGSTSIGLRLNRSARARLEHRRHLRLRALVRMAGVIVSSRMMVLRIAPA